jgi:hypothetical protein
VKGLRSQMIPFLIYLDRYRNEGTRVYSPHAGYTEALPEYRPDSRAPSFRLPSFQVPLSELNLYEAGPDPALRDLYISPSTATFFVHPQLHQSHQADPYLERVRRCPQSPRETLVSPSSSTRTLYVLEAEPSHALKVHFPFRVSRYGRRMRDEVVEQAINVSRELQAGIGSMDAQFSYFREVMGITFKNLEPESPRAENWGFLVREMRPYPHESEERALIPGFALYGRDFFQPESPPLIFHLLEGKHPATWVLEQIMFPIIRHWVSCYLNFGLLLEPHGQNVLLEMGEDGKVRRLVHRDLNLGIDNRRQRDLGIIAETENSYNRMETGDFSSIAYDKFMGGHFFDQLVGTLLQWDPTFQEEDFREPCRTEFARVFPLHEEYLPRTIKYFTERRDEFGKPLFEDTHQAPRWRP